MYTTEQTIEDFIKEYQSSRIIIDTSVRSVLKRAQVFERKFKKPFYKFTKEEALEMFSGTGAVSIVSLQNQNVILKHACNWKKYTDTINVTNIYETIGKNDLKSCINTDKKQKMIITREQLSDIQSNLLNYTDRCILELLFRGVGVEDWASRLTFLDIKQISQNDMCIYFKNGKKVEIDERCYHMISQSAKEDELISYNGLRVSKVVPQGVIYKVRFNAITENSDINDQGAKERRFRFLQRRLKIINDYLGLNLTPTSISTSGLLHEIQQGVKLNDLPFRQYVATAEAKEIAAKFGIYSVHAHVILIEKFREFFE